MGHAARQNLATTKTLNANYLRAIAAILVERGGEVRIPASSYALLDPEMVVKQEIDRETREVVFKLMVPPEATAVA